MDHPHLVHLVCYGPGDPRTTAKPLAPGDELVEYRHAVNFTRFYGSVYAPEPLEVAVWFANDQMVKAIAPYTTASGVVFDRAIDPGHQKYFPVKNELRIITDEDLPRLHYDALGTRVKYVPPTADKDPIGDKVIVTIYGVYMKLSVRNTSAKTIDNYRVTICGSVF